MADRPLFSICHTTARPEGWQKAYHAYIKRAVEPTDVEYVLCADRRWGFDATNLDLFDGGYGSSRGAKFECVWNEGRKCMVDGYAAAVAASTGSIIILGSDDIMPPDEWDVRLGDLIPDTTKDLAVHVSTGYYDGVMASGIQILSRARLERYGYVLYPEFESMYSDDDFLEQAYHDQVVIDGRHLMFPHDHPAGSDGWDEVYAHQNRAESFELGAHVLMRRRMERYSAPAPSPSPIGMSGVTREAASV